MESDKTSADDASTTNGGDNWETLGRECSAYREMAETLSFIDNLESISLVLESTAGREPAKAIAAADRYSEVLAEQAEEDEDDEPEVATDGREDAGEDNYVGTWENQEVGSNTPPTY
ncbi:hypothetical protein AUR64_17305 [Haloprofundus marisrubri]|uniref:Uncharacterized protein n=1 Tax=Haloprofundus marisrubri TaxID=1514971 RepID=A0A0W1R941_9EURY|nr:hypothetical protein [Haloprofundus marisrubri]KTG09524.1 hypothetical protein AUR64_17305 [Haloprofundus marisrubri]